MPHGMNTVYAPEATPKEVHRNAIQAYSADEYGGGYVELLEPLS